MIVSFADRATEDLYHGRRTSRTRRIPHVIVEPALVKLDMVNAAAAVLDIGSPPGNRLGALHGDLKGFHLIRVNNQWRVVFRWENNSAHDVQLVDYHT